MLMASNHLILAQPEANSTIDYSIPSGESARLSFTPEDISGLNIGDAGELVISFIDGGQLVVSNFDEFIQNGNTLYLDDGTFIDPAVLASAIGGDYQFNDISTAAGVAGNDNGVETIAQPGENTSQEISLVPGQQYACEFDPTNAAKVEIKDGQMILTFADGSQVVINNYSEVMAGDLPAELTLADGTVIDGEELLTAVTEIDAPTEEVLTLADVEPAAGEPEPQAEVREQEPSAEQVANIEPAAGDDIANTLANIEPAAGDEVTSQANPSFTTPGSSPFDAVDAIGAIGPTALAYGAPRVLGEVRDIQRVSTPIDPRPVIAQATVALDESDLDGGPLVGGGTLNVNYGGDGAGTIEPNGEVTVSCDSAGVDTLLVQGQLVDIAQTPDGYVGTIAGSNPVVTVFEFTIDAATGDYSYTQYESFDHSDTNDDNEDICLDFGIAVSDADGDITETNISILVADDAPIVTSQVTEAVDETDMVGGKIAVNGQFQADVGQDAPATYSLSPASAVSITGSVAGGTLTSGGVPVVTTLTGNTYTGEANGQVIYTLELNPTTGAYTYTLCGPLDHADGTNPDDVISFNFDINITDYDGDTKTGTVTVNVKDDAPTILSQSDVTVDETDANGGNLVATGQFAVDAGEDGIASFSPTGVSTFNATGSTGTTLSSGGAPVTVTLSGNTYTGTANGQTVFTMELNPTTGEYTYTQILPLDHADTTDPDDLIALEFGFTATDGDGDTVSGLVTVNVKDDGPSIKPTVATVDETDLTGGVSVTGTYAGDFGQDGPGTLAPSGGFTSGGSQLGGALTSNGVTVDVTFDAATNTYTGVAGTETVFTMVVNDDGSYQFDLLKTLDHADPNDPNDIINLDFGVKITDGDGDSATSFIRVNVKDDVPVIGDSKGQVDETNLDKGPLVYSDTVDSSFGVEVGEIKPTGTGPTGVTSNGVTVVTTVTGDTFTGTANGVTIFTLQIDSQTGKYTYTQFAAIDHADPNDPNDIVSLDFGVAIKSTDGSTDTGVITIDVADDAPEAKDDINGAEEGQFITGDVTGNDNLSEDNPNVVTNIRFDGVDYPITPGGFAQIDTPLGNIKMNSDGTYEYTTKNNDPDGVDQFTYTLTDNDGDSSTAKLDITVTPDGQPVAVSEQLAVDETNLTPGPMIFNDSLDIDFGIDGAGTVTPNGDIKVGGSLLNGQLTSGGVPVDVTFDAATNSYVGVAGTADIFTLTINNDGTYSFQLFDHIDHADNTDPNDIITLDFGVTVADADGDTAEGVINILIYDDAPVAYDDARVSLNESETVTGNVTTNDELSEDRPTDVVEVSFNSNAVAVPATGVATINGNYGTLTIASDGSYSYKANDNNPEGTDTFTYVLEDFDGDRDTAEFGFKVAMINDEPTVRPAKEVVDETDLGPLVETGTVVADFKGDGPGTIEGNDSFTSSGSRTGNVLSSNGTPVTVTFDDATNTYTGAAGGDTVFTLAINPTTGAYTYTQVGVLDHADGNNPNDVIDLRFGVEAIDKDGDKASTTITISVRDDAPEAQDVVADGVDETTVFRDGSQSVDGNVRPDFGNDGAGSVSGNNQFNAGGSLTGGALTSNGEAVTVSYDAASGTYTGSAAGETVFTMVIGSNGDYDFTLVGSLDHADGNKDNDIIDLNFGYTVTDYDGDKASAFIKVNVADDVPSIDQKFVAVDEDDLANGPITLTATVPHDFGQDGAGSIDPTGKFVAKFEMGGPDVTLTSQGDAITVTRAGDGYIGKAADGREIFSLSINPETGRYTYTQLDQIDHPDGSNPDDVIWLKFQVKITDADGDSDTAYIGIDVHDSGPVANNDNGNVNEGETINGNVINNDAVGADEPGSITNVTYNGNTVAVPTTGQATISGQFGTLKISADGTYSYTANSNNPEGRDSFTYTLRDFDGDTDTAKLNINVARVNDIPVVTKPGNQTVDESDLGPVTKTGDIKVNFGGDAPGTIDPSGAFSATGSLTGGKLTSCGEPVTVSVSGNTYTGVADGKTIFTLEIKDNGDYKFDLIGTLDHADGSNPNDVINLNFGIVAKDADGDTATTTLTINVVDDAPEISRIFRQVDEDDLAANGEITLTNTVPHDFGNDGAGTIKSNGDFVAKFEVGGPDVTLQSQGQNIVVTQTANGYIGKAGGRDVFSITVNPTNGKYTYKQFDQIDHPDGSDPDDVIWLKFGVTITDKDGDTDSAYIGIDVHDSGPKANDDHDNAKEGETVTGNVIANDNVGADEDGSIINVNFNGQNTAVPITGVATITGQFGVLKIAADGSYSYKANSNNPEGTDAFTYTLRDFDGDTDTAILAVCVDPKNDVPVIVKPGVKTVDETDLPGETVSGKVAVNFGGDAPGSIDPNGTFTSGGSRLDGKLTSCGETVTVSVSGNTYTGVADGKAVFTLEIKDNGDYKFDLLGPLDHADGSNPDDIIRLNFGVTAKDADGDTATTTISINVKDDGPSIATRFKPVDEDDLANGGKITLTNTIVHDYGADGAGSIDPTGVFTAKFQTTGPDVTLESKGQAINVTATANGYVGTAGGRTIFTLNVQDNGRYTYEQLDQIDHPNGNDADDVIWLKFGVQITDKDGDTATAVIGIDVHDSGPQANNDNGSTSEGGTTTGNVIANDEVGADEPGSITKVVFNGQSVNVPTTGVATITGQYGVLKISADGSYSYKANNNNPDGTDVFTYTLQDFDGDKSTAKLSIKVSPDDKNPIDISGHDVVDETGLNISETGNINVNYQGDGPGTTDGTGTFSSSGSRLGGTLTHNGTPVNVSYNNGVYTGKAGSVTVFTMTIRDNGTYTYNQVENLDHADGSNPNDVINLNFGVKATDADGDTGTGNVVIKVRDDAPTAKDDALSLNDQQTSRNGNVLTNDDIGADDGPGVSVVTAGTFNGTYGTLVMRVDGSYTYTRNGNQGGTDKFNYVMRDSDGDRSAAELKITVATIVPDAKPTDVTGFDAVDETNLNGGTLTETGTVSVNYHGDGPGTVMARNSFSSSDATLTHNGTAIAVTLSGGTFTGKAGSKTIFTMTVNANGTYSYKQFDNLDHPIERNANDTIDLRFGVKATDADGDSANGTVTIRVADDGPKANNDSLSLSKTQTSRGGNVLTNDDIGADDGPGVAVVNAGTFNGTYGTLVLRADGSYTYTRSGKAGGTDTFNYTMQDSDGDRSAAKLTINVAKDNAPTNVTGTDTVDETDLLSGIITEKGTVSVNYNGDGPGTVTARNSFSASDSTLTHQGTPIVVTLSGGTFTGKAGSKTIFTTTVKSDGSYTFKLYNKLDHPNTNDPNDNIALRFGIKATDSDGDSANGTLTINVRDDGPTARNDSDHLNSFEGRETGNVLANDSAGADGGKVVTTPGTYQGSFGRLVLNGDGSYTYTRTSNNAGTDRFNYTMRDRDGDTDSAQLVVTVDRVFTSGDGDGGGDGDGCPLVIDLDGDGIELISKENGVMFDIDEDGIADKTAWVGADDGILVHDENGDGIIGDHSEMFGNDRQGGFAMLSDDDSNNDGVVDAKDAIWSTLKVWQDVNGDAFSQADELFTMDQLGIQSISLSVQEIQEVIAGNDVKAVSEVTLEDGSTLDAYDAWFQYDSSAAAQDAFLFEAIAESAETLVDFNAQEGANLDISLLVEGQDDVTEAINDFVYTTEASDNGVTGNNSQVAGQASEIALAEAPVSSTSDELVNIESIVNQ